jgi:hypothetical protein
MKGNSMNKIIKLSLVAASIAAFSLSAADTNVELLEKMDAMQKQIDKLQDAQSDAKDELEERIDTVETATMTDKIDFGMEFRTRVDNFNNTDATGKEYKANNVWSNRLRLNMSSEITNDMKFTGRLSMYKNWADTGAAYSFTGQDPMQGRRPGNSGVYVERAYVDWTVLKGQVPVVLTIGRQPSSDGPSHQFKDNTVRKSTYSALSFDGAADGVVATVALNKLTSVDGMALRVGYGKGYQADTGMSYVGDPASLADSDVLGVFFDTGLGIDGSLLQVSGVQADDVVSNVPGDNKTIGEIRLYTAMLEFTNLANTSIDVFAHYAISQSKPNGQTSSYNGAYVGLLSTSMTASPVSTDAKSGSAYWLGARYTLPFETMNHPRIGLEYNHGSENWFSFTQGSNDLTNKLATRGSATEVYYIQPINRYAHLRLGATMIDYEYTNSGYQIGAPMDLATAATNNPTALDKLTNYYLIFNVAY